MKNRLAYSCLVAVLMALTNCTQIMQGPDDCSKFANEEYLEEQVDSSLMVTEPEYQDGLKERFNDVSVKGVGYEAYNLQYISSWGHGKLVKFEKQKGNYSLSVKCGGKENSNKKCKEYKIRISEEEWDELERMIYEFNFWTEETVRVNLSATDGYAYFLEGNRPAAEKCGKKSYKLTVRGAMVYDKLDALCGNILDYEDQLAFYYREEISRNKQRSFEAN